MSPSPRTAVLLLFLAAGAVRIAGAASPAAAASPTAAAAAVPVDARERWTVGMAAFRGEGLQVSDAWLAWSVPLLLRDQVAGLATHDVDAPGGTRSRGRRSRASDGRCSPRSSACATSGTPRPSGRTRPRAPRSRSPRA